MRVRRAEAPMSLTGFHCLAMLSFVVSNVQKHIIQVFCKQTDIQDNQNLISVINLVFVIIVKYDI